MIISTIGRYAILVHLAAAASFRGSSSSSNGLDPASPDLQRLLQGGDSCAGYVSKKDCPTGAGLPCTWQGNGPCLPAATTRPTTATPTPPPTTEPPTPPPTSDPTNEPTPNPTDAPTVSGIGMCSDDSAKTCWNVGECVCGGFAGGGEALVSASSSNLFGSRERKLRELVERDLQINECSPLASKECRANATCEWSGGNCLSTTTQPSQPPTPPPTTPPPTTKQPTTTPTDSPNSSPITNAPTKAPTACACLGVGPTKPPSASPSTSPTLKPTMNPTDAPTSEPTNNPTISPTLTPSAGPSVSPIKNPTDSPTKKPTNNPTDSPTLTPSDGPSVSPTRAPTTPAPTTPAPSTPAPTGVPTGAPTDAPTKNPTSNPTDVPTTPAPTTPAPTTPAPTTPSPTSLVQDVACPPTSDPMQVISNGSKTVTAANADTFCGIFLKKESGDLIPLARSYHGQDWESSPGPLACPTSDVTATSVYLPPLPSGTDDYVILTKNGQMNNDKQVAKFLEMTTFGPKKSEIELLNNTNWGAGSRASYIRIQMDLPATSHREYWRKRTNSKWDATAMPARSDHPCSLNSKWRTYSYTRQDRYDTITSQYIYHTFETVPEEADLTYTLYEADSPSDVLSYNKGVFLAGNNGYSGTGYYDFSGTDDHLEFTVDMTEAGEYPISFRFAMSSSSWNGNRPCQLSVNSITIETVYDFYFTGSWSYWKYSDLVNVNLNQGNNTIRLLVVDQNGGPNIDHLRVGKPPAIVMKTNGWPRAIARNGLHLLDAWPFEFTNETSLPFDIYPDPRQGDLYRYEYGRLRVPTGTIGSRYLDFGNPSVDFTGYEQYLPSNVFIFTESDVFTNTSSDLYPYPLIEGQEMLLTTGSSSSVCANVPPFAEERDAPIIGKLPNGKWIQWSPTIMFEDNGPSINDLPGDMATNVLLDGGGKAFVDTNEKLKCSNAQRSFINEDTCFLSQDSLACSASQPIGEVLIPMNTSNILEFYNLAAKYVYAIKGLVMENIDESPCAKTVSRWEIDVNATCSLPTQLEADTIAALGNAITSSSDSNEFTRDVTRTLPCNSIDETVQKIDIQIQVGPDCFTHVHPNHYNVYDFSGWVTGHPGGELNIRKWAQGWEGNPGWFLHFPFYGNATRGIPEHPMQRWTQRAGSPNIAYVTRLGNSIAYRDLPNDLKTDGIAQFFGATPQSLTEGGVVVCGSMGEVANDPAAGEQYDVRSNEHTTSDSDRQNNQKAEVWTEIALSEPDQLRQRMAWALSQIITTVPGNIDGYDRTEIYLHYYDIFVSNAFGNYHDILAKTSYSPLMAEHLSYLRSKSHSYVYEDENKRISRADENYAREVMQLFTIGLTVLNDDGTPVLDPATGNPLETYTNEDIESFARAWTGFERTASRGNYEETRTGTSDNRLDPMRIIPEWRDPFPKTNLNGGFIGDGYALCKDLPAQSFLKKGAGYRLLGGKTSPELIKDPSFFADDGINNILRFEVSEPSALYSKLFNSGNYEMFVTLDVDLDCTSGTFECDVDTVRVVKVGSIYYEFVEQPCVQMAFYDNGKQIQLQDNTRRGQMCANPDLTHAREACCREDIYIEVRTAVMETGVTYKYEGERMTWDTAHSRCLSYGRDLCVYENLAVTPNGDYRRKGYHWTNKDCGINVKINSEGYIAIVHDAMSTYKDTIPWLVEEENTLNWFRVYWNGDGSYPGSDPTTNSCEDNNCDTTTDGSCLCKTTVADSVVFTDTSVSKEDVMSQLFIGALGPQAGSNTTDLLNGVIVHVTENGVGTDTVFEVNDKGRIMYFKNILSTVNLEGWAMVPQIYEAEDATISNALVRNNTSSATGGKYVEGRYGDETTFVEWNVDVPTAGTYSISLRYAHDSIPRTLRVFVNNTTEVSVNPSEPINVTNVFIDPVSESLPLERCQGDCDNDGECANGLFCFQRSGDGPIPSCIDDLLNTNWDYCLKPFDYDYGLMLFPTGGWDDDWHDSDTLQVDLTAGPNTIRVQVPLSEAGPNIDYLKVEGQPTSTSPSSFRNPSHFMSLITDYYSGDGEQNLRDAQYETEAVLDNYFYQDNVAPFLCIRIMQRFSFSNPSPRYMASCVEAFRTGLYTSGEETFGSEVYGSLEAMAAAIFLDKEATESAIAADPSHGSIREPMLKVINLMRSMDYQTAIPTILDGAPMQTTYKPKLWKIDEKIGHGPYEFPTVFSYFLPEYVPDAGPNLAAKLASPESMTVTMPNVVNMLNGMFSLIKYGLSDCGGGFSVYPGYAGCSDNGLYQRSFGHLFYEPTGEDDYARAADLALLLTAGRLSDDNLNTTVAACSTEPDQPSKNRCMQQLIVTTGEFHTTSTVTQSGEDRATENSGGNSTETYKAVVYFYLGGGLDSYMMLAPHTCTRSVDVYDRYRAIRGKTAFVEGVGLPLQRLLPIPAHNDDQPCETFGIHENLPMLQTLYDQGKLNFIANAGLLGKPNVNVGNYRGETPVQLFAHNAMTLEAKREDLFDEYTGTGVGGRMADVLTKAGISTNLFSIDGQQVLLTGEAGQGPSQFILSSSGLSAFNANPSISNMDAVIKALNNDTTADSGFYAETWSSKLSDSMDKQQLLKQEVDATTVTAIFPTGSTADEFEMVTRIMQTREVRKSKRDIFFVEDGGYDTHSNVDAALINNFMRINGVIEAFVEELKVLGLWNNTVVVQFSEFSRTLDPNTGAGTDHAWGGNHFMFGGSVKGGHVLGHYPSDFEQGDAAGLALSRGRMIPTTPWDAMWKGVAEWFGIPEGAEGMDKVLPMHKNFPPSSLYNKTVLFDDTPPPPTSASASNKEPNVMQSSLFG